MKSEWVGVISQASDIKKQEIEKLSNESVMLPKKDRSPRPGGTYQHQNPPMARRAL